MTQATAALHTRRTQRMTHAVSTRRPSSRPLHHPSWRPSVRPSSIISDAGSDPDAVNLRRFRLELDKRDQ